MRIGQLEEELARRAPWELAEPWDNVGLLLGRRDQDVSRALVALDATSEVIDQATCGGFDALITHHPLLLSLPRRMVSGSRTGEAVLRLAETGTALFACHTNVDAAPGGLGDIVAEGLELDGVHPLRRTRSNWKKFVGFIPPEVLDEVMQAVYAAGAGRIGEYSECGYRLRGEGTFRPGDAAQPQKGEIGNLEFVDEVRVETVVPAYAIPVVVQAFIDAHPYEEPAFDIYALENLDSRAGIGRVGVLPDPSPLAEVVRRVEDLLLDGVASSAGASGAEVNPPRVRWSVNGSEDVRTVAVVPGSGRDLIEEAGAQADVLVTGDLHHHDAERAVDNGLDLVDVPHGSLERWAFYRWIAELGSELSPLGIDLQFAASDRLWCDSEAGRGGVRLDRDGYLVLRIDGGSRGNPGPAAIGVVLEDEAGMVHDEIGTCIGNTTNNVAEYQALLTGLEAAQERGARRLRIYSDSELLVRQLRREYRVKDPKLRELFAKVRDLVQEFERVEIRHVPRGENSAADALVNRALDTLEADSL